MEPSFQGRPRSFRLDQTAYEAAVRGRLPRLFAGTGLSIVFLFVARWLGWPAEVADAPVFVYPVVAVILGAVSYRSFRQAQAAGKAGWNSYELSFEDDVLRREAANLPTIEIRKSEVDRIFEVAGSGTTVQAAERSRYIFVPVHLVGYGEARAELARWKSFTEPNRWEAPLIGIAWALAIFATDAATLRLQDIRVAMLAGAALVVLVVLMIRTIRKQRVWDAARKTMLTRILFLFALAPVLRLSAYFLGM